MRKIAVIVAMSIASFLTGFGTSRAVMSLSKLIPNPVVGLVVYLAASTGLAAFAHRTIIVPVTDRLMAWATEADRIAAEPRRQPSAQAFAHPVA